MRKTLISAAILASLGLSGCFSSSSSSSDPVSNDVTESGAVIDWYLQGAFVFADFNGNSQYDADTDVAADDVTDSDGNFTLTVPEEMGTNYVIVSQGGTDTATGETFNGVLKASPGATALSPITTLIAEVGDEDAVRTFLGLGADADLSADPATSTELFAASQALVYVISSITNIIDFATTESVDAATAQLTYSNLVTEAIAAAIAGGSTTFDDTFVASVITTTATDLGVDATDADTLANKANHIVTQSLNIIDAIEAEATLDITTAETLQDAVAAEVEDVFDPTTDFGSVEPVEVTDGFLENDEVEYDISGVSGGTSSAGTVSGTSGVSGTTDGTTLAQ